jgi:hypothetical protein
MDVRIMGVLFIFVRRCFVVVSIYMAQVPVLYTIFKLISERNCL